MADSDIQLTVIYADTFWKRFRGLMFKKSIGADEGLLLTHCNAIHTFFMRFELDVIFLGKNFEVVKLCERVRPNRFGVYCMAASALLECRAGFISEKQIRPNHILKLPADRAPGETRVTARFG